MVGTGGTPNYFSFDGTSIDMRGSITITAGPLASPGDFATKTNLAGATVSASNAQSAAESTAASDATSKANTAQSNAATDATSKANTAESNAATDATTKANAAEAAASASAATDIFTTNAGAIYKPVSPSGAGLYLGATHLGFYNGSDWKTYMASSGDFYLAGAGSNGLTWDYSANTLTIDGAITARTGYIGNGTSGFTINSAYFANGKTTLTDSNAGVYVGTDGISLGASSVFKVTSAGALTATSATISGNITAATGTIGGWTVGSTLSATNILLDPATPKITLGSKATLTDSNTGLYLGTDGLALGASSVFKVTSAGALTATSATITGAITAESGFIGTAASGFTLTSAYFTSNASKTSYTDTDSGVYVGTDGIALGTGQFKVSAAGALTATSVDVSGEINASSGTFTGNVNVDGTLTAGTSKFGESVSGGNHGIWLDANNYWYDTGTIKAQDGTIGGWTLGSGALTGGIVTLTAAGSIQVGSASGQRVDLASSKMTFTNSSNNTVLSLENAISTTINISSVGNTTYSANGGLVFTSNGAVNIGGGSGTFHEGYWDQNHFISQCNNQTEKWTHVLGNYCTTSYGANLDVLGTYMFTYQGASNADIDVKGARIISTDASFRTGNTVEGLNIQVNSHLFATGATTLKGINMYIDGNDVSSNYGIYIDPGSQAFMASRVNWGTAYGIYSKAKIASTNNIIAYVSDKRLKEDLKIIDNPIDKIKSLEGITFTWNDKSVNNRRGERDVGLIAQDVQKVLPEAIELFQHDKDEVKNGALGGDLLNIQYQKLTALLIEGIKEQQEQIEFLQERVTILEKDIRE